MSADPFATAGSGEFAPDEMREEPTRRWVRDPASGKWRWYARPSSFAEGVPALEDSYVLDSWRVAVVAVGAARRNDLVVLAKSKLPDYDPDDKGSWWPFARIARDMANAAEADARANLGTALHSFTQHRNEGRAKVYVPDEFLDDMEAYDAALEDAGLEVCPEYLERLVLTNSLDRGMCGRIDNLLREKETGELVVADLKSGRNVPLQTGHITVTQAVYTRMEWMCVDEKAQEWEPMPKVAQDRSYVIEMPAGSGEAFVHRLPVEVGWEAAQRAAWLKEYGRAARRKHFWTTVGTGKALPSA